VFYRAPQVGLSAPAVNAQVNVTLPTDRWLLLAPGPAWGPAVLFWGTLLVALLAAWLLGRIPGSPLTTGQWALLALGLSQIPTIGAFLVAGFFFALAWRRGAPLGRAVAFDAFQLLLVLWALVAIVFLYQAVETGLLLRPDMQVAGNGSSATLLRFYVDRVPDRTPAVTVVSLPLWVYRVAMLAWSGWLAVRIVGWITWAWRSFSQGGVWKSLRKPATAMVVALAAAALLPATLTEAQEPAAPRLADLAWIAGRWIDDAGGNLSEEIWAAPVGDSMMGMWRYVAGGKVRIFELLTIGEHEGGLALRLRHFDPRLAGREDKERPVVLKLVRLAGREAAFEGTESSGTGTVRLTYRRPSDDTLSVTLDKAGGKEEFRFRRAPAP
jgi:hypothetical protein